MVVSVMSWRDQKKLLLRAKVDCYWRMKEAVNKTTQGVRPHKCPVIWDDLLCWDEAAPDTLMTQPCPDYVNGFNKYENATKYCSENGTWLYRTCMGPTCKNDTWTNFTMCDRPNFDLQFHTVTAERLRLLYTIGYSISLAALIIAVTIMCCCRRLHCKSNSLHINLFIAFIMRALASFIKDLSFVGNVGFRFDVKYRSDGTLEFLQHGLHWECKLLFSVFNYTISASMMWIFIEGLYLHMLIYRTLSTERRGVKMYIVLGWVLPIPFLVSWIIVKALLEDTYCWNIQIRSEYFWILKAPGVAVVLINFLFFLDIFRILFIRARANQRHLGRSKYRKLAKFILVLMPLFGVMYIVFFVAFPTEFRHEEFNVAYLYIEMGYNSFQGFVLAVLFCFLNEEVHSELRRIWKRHKTRRTDILTFSKSYAGISSYRNNSPAIQIRRTRLLKRLGSNSSSDVNVDKPDLYKQVLYAQASKRGPQQQQFTDADSTGQKSPTDTCARTVFNQDNTDNRTGFNQDNIDEKTGFNQDNTDNRTGFNQDSTDNRTGFNQDNTECDKRPLFNQDNTECDNRTDFNQDSTERDNRTAENNLKSSSATSSGQIEPRCSDSS
ncbi:secretin receptor-like [Gigantopelta aegis]|uniref:secretin receptor-like n=1 Tax=Gigantopelta aegis TaxID=1735272 RepID=UPI001B889E40|nr:secretin receptor-like [Gigantopelta aegis]